YRVLQDEGQPDVVTEFIDAFLQDCPNRIERLRDSVTRRQTPEIKSAAHALKGSSASVGAMTVSSLCGLLAPNARAGSIVGSHELLLQIELELDRARDELQKHRRP